jgi:leucyl-tRNA synthetase
MLSARYEAIETIAHLVAPMMPHLAEQIFATVRPDLGLIAQRPWPEADAELVKLDVVTLAVQVNGKLRATITVQVGDSKDNVIGFAKNAVSGALAEQTIVKEIYVPERIVNFVVKP